MKTSFTSLSLLLAASFPGSILAEIAGIPVPDAVDAAAFGLFMAILPILTLVAEYSRRSTQTLALTTAPASSRATEERRLAA